MKISIIIPVYNVEKYLDECINSILISKHDFEVLLVDDGSTDSSSMICDKYAKLDKRIKVFHKINGGVSSARNFGLKNASGEYVLFVDSDDILSSNWDSLIDFLKNDDIYYFATIKRKVSEKNDLLKYIIGNTDEKTILAAIYSKAYRRKFLIDNNIIFNDNLINGEDMIYNIECVLNANSYQIIDFHYYYYRQSLGQATRKFNKKIIESDKKFHIILDNLLKKYGVDEEISNDIKKFCINNAILLLFNRISYIKKYSEAKLYFLELKQSPYDNVIKNNNNIFFKLYNKKIYSFIYYYLKIRKRISITLKYGKNKQYIEI